jgi:sodium/potassium-transporting ATPase subunit alpha
MSKSDGIPPVVTDGDQITTGGNVRPSLERPRISVETAQTTDTTIARQFAQARHSIDIVREAQVKPIPKKVVKKAEKYAVKINEHTLTVEQLCDLYKTQFDKENPEQSFGLSSQEAKERLMQNGPNMLTPPKETPEIIKFLRQFKSPFVIIPVVAGIIAIVVYAVKPAYNIDRLVFSLVLFGVTIFNASVAYIEERKGLKALKYDALGAPKCRVIRDGKLSTINVTDVVLGDLVKVKGGDKLPADLVVLTNNGLKVDNASLTGEGEPLSRSTKCTHHNPLETKNLMFYGTLVTEGEGIGLAIRTGDNTVIGQIAHLAQSTVSLDTPLSREMFKFVLKIGSLALAIGIFYFILSISEGLPVVEDVFYATGLVVANVPQGLIPTVTMLLTIAVRKLIAVKVKVKRLECVETLGSTTVIASDKTGTLTQNRMTVVDLWFDGKMSSVVYERYMINKPEDSKRSSLSDEKLSTFELLQRCIALCNRTSFEPDPENLKKPILDRDCIGDASETALVKYIETRPDLIPIEEMRNLFPKVFEIPFNSKNKWQLSIHKNASKADDETNPRFLLIKGAPERIIAKCSKIRCDDQECDLDAEWKNNFQQAYEHLAAKGERVLGFAALELDPAKYPPSMDKEYNEANIPQDGYVFLGLTGLMDPPKLGVPEAIAKCKTAGIQVIMVTGDHPATARSIARQVGIIWGKTVEDIAEEEDCKPEEVDPERAEAIVIHGEKLETLMDKDWRMILRKKQIVFARTSPQQKLQIVERLQKIGHIVAVTGDGVNDSPALRKADLGISMNITGSDVSKDAASMILLDDNFASIVNGIEEGRLIFDNLKKTVAYTISHCLPEIVPFVVYVILGIPLPVTSILIIWIDLGTELLPAISLAYEKAEADIMHRPPRARTDSLVSFPMLCFSYFQMGVLECLACFFGYFTVFGYYGFTPRSLLFMNKYYFKVSGSPYLFMNGYIYTPSNQISIRREAESVYFLGIVMMQWVNIFNCKTRINSLFHQGVISNRVLLLGIVWAASISCIMFYIPGLNEDVLFSRPVGWRFWLCALPFMLVIFVVDETRKLLIRKAGFDFLLY